MFHFLASKEILWQSDSCSLYTTLYSDLITFSDVEVLKENQHQLEEHQGMFRCAELRT